MKKGSFLAAGLLLGAQCLFALSIPIAVLDLDVQSENPKHKNIGKAVPELIAMELARSDGLRIIDRKRRVEALEESDPALAELPIGRLLAARYVASGNVTVQGGTLSVELHLVDVRSGQGSWDLQVAGSFADSEVIAERFAQAMLAHLGLPLEQGSRGKGERKQKAAEEALIAFAEALYHYDRNESSEARMDLARARRIDPKNKAVLLYFDKLITSAPSFKAAFNPAYLGILQYDQWFTFIHGDLPVWSLVHSGNSYCSSSGRMVMGYSLPVGKRFGIQINLAEESALSSNFYGGFPEPFDSQIVQNRLAVQGLLGWAVSDYCAMGFGMSLGWQFPRLYDYDFPSESWNFKKKHAFPVAFALGVLAKNRQATVVLDFLAEYSLGKQYGWENEDALLYEQPNAVDQPFTLQQWTRSPLRLEANLTLALGGSRAFLNVKQLNEIYLDKANWTARLIPAFELKLGEWVAVRAGLAASLYLSSGTVVDHGFGGSGGLTVRLSRTGWYLDVDGFLSNRTLTHWYDAGFSRTRSSAFIGITKKPVSRAR